jgi:uncharacterized membrane protein
VPPPRPVRFQLRQRRIPSPSRTRPSEILASDRQWWFVYVHIIWFSCWIGFGVEKYPYGLLTMIVLLEAIFLSTFVLISQNRADAKRRVIADQQWQTVKEEGRQIEQLLNLSNEILDLTKAIHSYTKARPEDAPLTKS